jgi:hypothetical protein
VAVEHERLLAGQAIAAREGLGAGRHRVRRVVRALLQREREHALGLRDRRQDLLLLGLVPAEQERVAAEQRGRNERHPEEGPRIG